MGELSIKRVLFGYRRRDVDVLIAARDVELGRRATELDLRGTELRIHCARVEELEAVAERLTAQVVDCDRQLVSVRAELEAATAERGDGLRLLDALSSRVEELHAQARGQATRIRLSALKDAVEVSSQVRALGRGDEPGGRGSAVEVPIRRVEPRERSPEDADEIEGPLVLSQNGQAAAGADDVLVGSVRIDVGPLADFSQLIRIEDAVKAIEAATDISIKRFSGGRATLAMHLGEPVELLRELEARSDLGFTVRRAGSDELILDVGDAASST